jgi:hypothetical protein
VFVLGRAILLSLAPRDLVERWLARVRAQPGYRPIKRDPLGKAP